jgi:hypothetical protein
MEPEGTQQHIKKNSTEMELVYAERHREDIKKRHNDQN